MNFGSIRAFEPDRSALLRIVVTVLIGLILGRLLLRADLADVVPAFDPRFVGTWLRHRPLVLAALIYALATIISTVLALDPWRSLLGSYERGYGAALDLAAMATAGALASRAGSPVSVRQIVAGAQFGVVGTAVIALLQYVQVVAMPGETLSVTRPVGTIGSPLFLGAVMAIGLPLALAMALATLASAGRSEAEPTSGGTWRTALRGGLVCAAALLLLSGGYDLTASMSDLPWLWAAWPVTMVVAAWLWFQVFAGPPGRGADAGLLDLASAFTVLLIVAGSAYAGWPAASVPGSALWLVLALMLLGADRALPDTAPGSSNCDTQSPTAPAVRWLGVAGWLGVAVVEAFALMLTGSRGPLVGAAIGVAVTCGAAAIRGCSDVAARRLGIVVGLVLVAALTTTVTASVDTRGTNPFDFESGTGLERRLIWVGDGTGGGIAGIIARAPIWRIVVGHGAESIPLFFERSYPLSLGLMIDFAVPDRAHMVLLDLLVHHGLFGLLSWVACVGLACRQCWRLTSRSTPLGRVLACGLLGGLLGHLVEGLSGIVVVPTLVLWWITIGMIVSLSAADWDATSRLTVRPTVRVDGRAAWRPGRARVVAAALCAGAAILVAPLHGLTVLADMRLAEARAVERRWAGIDTFEARGAAVRAYAQAVRLAPHEPTFLHAYGDAVWRMADGAVLVTAPEGAGAPSSAILVDPGAATRFVAAANRQDLLAAAKVAFEASHRARPELSSPLASLARVELTLYAATGETRHLLWAIEGYRAASVRAPNQVHLLQQYADALLQLAEIELLAGRSSEAVTHLREADDVLQHVFAIGGGRVLRLDDRVETLRRLRREAD